MSRKEKSVEKKGEQWLPRGRRWEQRLTASEYSGCLGMMETVLKLDCSDGGKTVDILRII